MQLTCFKCTRNFPTINFLLCHLKGIHALEEPCELICGQKRCKRLFTSFHSFQKHVRSHIKKQAQKVPFVTNQLFDLPQSNINTQDSFMPEDFNNFNDAPDAQPILDIAECFDHRRIFLPAARFLLNLMSAAIPLSNINDIRNGLDEMFSVFACAVQHKVSEVFTMNSLENKNTAEIFLTALKHPFQNIDTVKKLSTYLEKVGALNIPTEIVLGHRWETKMGKQVQVEDTFMFVPISKTLKYIFRHSDCWSACTFNETVAEGGILCDYQDGSNYQAHRNRHPLPSVDFITHELVIQLYYDDVETVNSIGTKASIHKLGAFYFILKNFPAIFNSNLANVHLVALTYVNDIKKYGINAVLRAIVDDLKCMEDGFQIEVQGEATSRRVRCILGQITGDNLGIHTCLGFVESFNSDFCCDLCTADKKTMQNSFTEIPKLQRTVAQYEAIVNKLAAQQVYKAEFGIKVVSILKELKYYHPAKNDTGDIMHDILEGIAPLEIKLVLYNFIYIQNLFDLNLLNNRLRHFPYGLTFQDKKPSLITENRLKDNSSLLGQRSSQTMTLLIVLPLLIGDKVPSDSEHWKLLLLLLKISNIVFSPAVHKSDMTYLAALIADHNSLFKNLFPNKNLMYKHHRLTHYPSLILKNGPQARMWCMRFEAKHNFFKRIAHIVWNFRNIAYTLAFRHQLAQCSQWWKKTGFKQSLVVGTFTETLLYLVPNGETISSHFADKHVVVYIANFIEAYGTVYKPGMSLIADINEHGEPTFICIDKIVIMDKKAHLLCLNFRLIQFDEHLHSYTVTCDDTNTVSCYTLDSLHDYHPVFSECTASLSYQYQ
ncbi:uncharacterized protein LOC105850147 isoform X1 [Hydra vulgaris]|uniref:uncharacterized protein LOC105850147 isoform X1 n=1 Tax=Hydra vulgaris TaxID=6087 RepID=UPI001F5F8444|nr:uncharacterized protein LOC105850147 isoform X1 [Hydra vulgaris]